MDHTPARRIALALLIVPEAAALATLAGAVVLASDSLPVTGRRPPGVVDEADAVT